ncbi:MULTISPECIES: TadE/TadG family type IV pilus assembly protein [Mumia]|uniref:TadE/TadG family type IV pilus assembly protein n=1 Tax=Mumia xiangluensis TaxID=1678900 RepID=A0ABW1QQ14_9ACTN|nr:MULTISPECIES: TadE/TadG family type IV pilus assembly protein [Mumia]
MAEFCLVMVVLVPLVLAIVQLALVLHVRNTITAAAADGARAASRDGATLDLGAQRAREQISRALSPRYARDVVAERAAAGGQSLVVVRVRTTVPALGLFGATVEVDATGRAVLEAG